VSTKTQDKQPITIPVNIRLLDDVRDRLFSTDSDFNTAKRGLRRIRALAVLLANFRTEMDIDDEVWRDIGDLLEESVDVVTGQMDALQKVSWSAGQALPEGGAR